MNCVKKLNSTHSKFKVQCWAIFSFLIIALSFTACDKDNAQEEYLSLKIVNQSNDHWPITSMTLVGYEFKNLSIDKDDSQTFSLTEGISVGYSDVNITVRYGPPGSLWTSSTKVDFGKGQTTTITLKGCISYEECTGFYLE